MDKQNAILKSQTITDTFEVIGQGGMIYEPCQIGEWWVMPADQYTGTIPPDIIQKWENFKALNIPVVGYLIADDMRDVLIRRELEAEQERERQRKAEEERQLKLLEEQRQREAQDWEREAYWKRLEEERRREIEQRNERIRQQENEKTAKTLLTILGVAGGIALLGTAGLAVLGIGAVLAGLQFDPILIAVLPDGRWICLGAWWD
jgi:hypothetical protein